MTRWLIEFLFWLPPWLTYRLPVKVRTWMVLNDPQALEIFNEMMKDEESP